MDLGPAHTAVDKHTPPVFGLYHADTRDLQTTLSTAFEEVDTEPRIDVTITSPPYADAKDYGYDEDLQVGLGDDYEDYLDELRNIYKQTYNLTADNGSLWIIVNTLKKNGRTVRLPTDIADICENLENKTHCENCGTCLEKNRETGAFVCPAEDCSFTYDALADSWQLQDIVIWNKQRALPYSGTGKFRNVFEYVLCFSKQNDFHFNLDKIRISDPTEFKDWWINYPERYHPRGKVPDNIWEMVTPTQGGWGNLTIDHPAPFPRQLVERIVQLTTETDDVVFDPFAGTGTVLAQAEAMGRKPLGFELSEEYVEAFPTLRDEILEEWADRQANDETLVTNQATLATTLWQLRQLNYPRKLLQSIPDSYPDRDLEQMGINTIFVAARNDPAIYRDPETTRVDAICTVVLDNRIDEEKYKRIKEMLVAARKEEPCSDMPVDIEFSIQSVTDFLDGAREDYRGQELYLYDNNTYNYPTDTITLEEWQATMESPSQWRSTHVAYEYPPVISPLFVNVDAKGEPVVDTDDLTTVTTGTPGPS